MSAGPITDSARLYQRIRRWAREICAAVIITVAAAALLAAANWRLSPAPHAIKPVGNPALTLADDQHPVQ